MKEENFFDNWNLVKKRMHGWWLAPEFHEREVWICSIGMNIGHEQNGKRQLFQRPIVIIKKFGNSTFWGIPLTSKPHPSTLYFALEGTGSWAILSQFRLWDGRRLIRKVRRISEQEFTGLIRAIMCLLKETATRFTGWPRSPKAL